MIERSIASLVGIQIIPSDDIPAGFKRWRGDTIFVNPWNYAVMRSLSAKGIIFALGILAELEREKREQPERETDGRSND